MEQYNKPHLNTSAEVYKKTLNSFNINRESLVIMTKRLDRSLFYFRFILFVRRFLAIILLVRTLNKSQGPNTLWLNDTLKPFHFCVSTKSNYSENDRFNFPPGLSSTSVNPLSWLTFLKIKAYLVWNLFILHVTCEVVHISLNNHTVNTFTP